MKISTFFKFFLPVFVFFILSSQLRAQECNYSDANASDACTIDNVMQIEAQFNELYEKAQNSNDEGLISASDQAKNNLFTALRANCVDAQFPLGCQIEYTVNYVANLSNIIADYENNDQAAAEPQEATATDSSQNNAEISPESAEVSNVVEVAPQAAQETARNNGMSFLQIVGCILIVIAMCFLIYILTTTACPSCQTRKYYSSSPYKVLDREVRYRDVKRHVRDRHGRIIASYDEAVPKNHTLKRYQLQCGNCGHRWSYDHWETS